MKASILAIGTEVTSGQINNSNASALAQKLAQFGVETTLHMSVPDDIEMMLQALQYCSQKNQILILTGGLGPTSDDFTRNVVAKWLNLPLEFYQPTYDKIEARLKERGLVVREMQKQQCYYPQTAKVLANSQGTADGFYITQNQTHLFVLPGPPTEIEAIWKDHMHKIVHDITRDLDPILVESWNVLAISEQELAHTLEPLTEKLQKELSFTTGYRINLPYNEFKILYSQSQKNKLTDLFQKIDVALKDHLVLKNGKDLSEMVTNKLAKIYSRQHFIEVEDFATQGFFLQRLQQSAKKQNLNQLIRYGLNTPLVEFNDTQVDLKINMKWVDTKLQLKLKTPHKTEEHWIESPYKNPQNIMDRYIKYVCEITLSKCLEVVS